MNKNLTVLIILVLLIIAGGFVYLRTMKLPSDQNGGVEPVAINSFEDCEAAGYPVMESYPARCAAPDGRTFTQDIGNELQKRDLITIDTPRPNARVTSPISLAGQARGNWYFEASFPIELRDASGTVIAQHYAEAQSDWMTTEFVPFKAQLQFPAQPAGSKGTLILRKDNPSGLSEHDDSLIVPVTF